MGTYDQTTLVTIKGTGATEMRGIEIAGPNGLMKKGVTKGLLNVGDSVAFEAWMPKDPRFGNTPNGRTMAFDDGRRFDVGDNWGDPPPTRTRQR